MKGTWLSFLLSFFIVLLPQPGESQLLPRGAGWSRPKAPEKPSSPGSPHPLSGSKLKNPDRQPIGLPDLPDDSPTYVLRGETGRTAKDVQQAGGLYAQGRGKVIAKDDEDLACNLIYHVEGSIAPISKYVSTTTSKEIAFTFATDGLEPVGELSRYGTIYMIAVDPKMINTIKSIPLGDYPESYRNQKEFSVTGGVSMKQIKGWYQPKKIDHEEVHWEFTENSDFDNAYLQAPKDGGAQPQLAGSIDGSKERLERYVERVIFKGDESGFKQFWAPEREAESLAAFQDCAGLKKRDAKTCNPSDEAEGSKSEDTNDSKDLTHQRDKPTTDVTGKDLVQSAEEIAKKEFKTLAAKFGVMDLVRRNGGAKLTSLDQLFTRFKGYKNLPSMSRPKLRLMRASSGALAVAGLGLYIKSVVDEFSEDSSALDRAAVVTSILPFVGCGVQAVAAQEHGRLDLVDTSLCVVGDALLLSPAWPAWFLIQGLRYLLGTSIKTLTPREIRARRNQVWNAYLRETTKYIESVNFTSDIETHFKVEIAAVLFTAAEAHGKLDAGRDLFLNAAATDQARRDVINDTSTMRISVQGDMCAAILGKMHELQGPSPNHLDPVAVSRRGRVERPIRRQVFIYHQPSHWQVEKLEDISTYRLSRIKKPNSEFVQARGPKNQVDSEKIIRRFSMQCWHHRWSDTW
ncbi:putative enterotoxin [Ophiocordyceps unilateralis]|uniref:Enterotoxin n=1 Tax=Ophiocordyceps unilateralis TaxID=268505 RepID=A0A2A9PKT6_OPHUN|nr:putative enterotoxin [Ophiocordyceps unilateralis]